ncbi:MAG: glycosyltransferase family 4 protein [Bacteroidia bacterium]|nr:glycosyltransferase family 4 protein [Bacteroidia bacterium]
MFISPHRHDEIIAAGAKHNLAANKIITKKASRKEVPLLLSLSNFSVFFIKPCYSKQSSSPTKHGEIMAMGIPLITNSGVGDVQAIVEQYHSGIVINEFTKEAYETAALKIATGNNWNSTEIRKGAEEFYSLQSAIEKYNRIYGNILQQ